MSTSFWASATAGASSAAITALAIRRCLFMRRAPSVRRSWNIMAVGRRRMNGVYLSVRALHVLFGAIWLGMAVFASFFVMPAIQEAGPEGGKVMAILMRRGLPKFI